MKILVLSCDKNEDLWFPFHHCIEKYWKDHPEIIYKSETKKNPYYRTLLANYPLNIWSKGIREVLDKIDDNQILVIMDDIFIRKPVDKKRIKYASDNLRGACFNFEKSFDNDIETDLEGFKLRHKGSSWEVSIMCGLWDKESFKKILKDDLSPWDIEVRKESYGMDFYINSAEFIIDWGYVYGGYSGICKGKWCRETTEFLKSEKLDIDYNIRGFAD